MEHEAHRMHDIKMHLYAENEVQTVKVIKKTDTHRDMT